MADALLGQALDQVVLGAGLHHFDRQGLAALAGQHHHRRRVSVEPVAQGMDEVDAVEVGQVVVEQHAVRRQGL